MKKDHIIVLLFLFLFFIPIHFFILGEGYGYGIQGLCYRYQIGSQEISFIPLSYELGYVLSDTITGKSAGSILCWILGTITFSLGTIIFLIGNESQYSRIVGILILISAGGFIISSIFQYGFFFSGPAGISILVGVPALFALGMIIMGDQV